MEIVRNLNEEEHSIFAQDPTPEEVEAKEFSKKKNNFYRIVASNKKTIKELLKLNFLPILIKILIKLNYSKSYKSYKLG